MTNGTKLEAIKPLFVQAISAEAERVAGANRLINKRTEQPLLNAFLQEAAEASRTAQGAGATLSTDELVSAATELAEARWSAVNQPPGAAGSQYLSQAEIQAVRRQYPVLGLLTQQAYLAARAQSGAPVVTFTSDSPDARMEQTGDVITLISLRGDPTVGRPKYTGTLTIDGRALPIESDPRGNFHASWILDTMPAGYWGELVDDQREGDLLRSSIRIGKDKGGLTEGQALAVARDGLTAYLRDVRMHEDDWKHTMAGVPSTWEAMVAGGVLEQIARFGDFTQSEGEVISEPDEYIFAGRGPYGLYTEVAVTKSTGKVSRVYIEID